LPPAADARGGFCVAGEEMIDGVDFAAYRRGEQVFGGY